MSKLMDRNANLHDGYKEEIDVKADLLENLCIDNQVGLRRL